MDEELEVFSATSRLLEQANFPEMSGKSLVDVARLILAYRKVVARLTSGELRIVEAPTHEAA